MGIQPKSNPTHRSTVPINLVSPNTGPSPFTPTRYTHLHLHSYLPTCTTYTNIELNQLGLDMYHMYGYSRYVGIYEYEYVGAGGWVSAGR
jgi:hypothetical protein